MLMSTSFHSFVPHPRAWGCSGGCSTAGSILMYFLSSNCSVSWGNTAVCKQPYLPYSHWAAGLLVTVKMQHSFYHKCFTKLFTWFEIIKRRKKARCVLLLLLCRHPSRPCPHQWFSKRNLFLHARCISLSILLWIVATGTDPSTKREPLYCPPSTLWISRIVRFSWLSWMSASTLFIYLRDL